MTDALAQLGAAITAAAPHANVLAWAAALTAPMRSAGITTPRRIAMFIGQVAEESGDFRALVEDLYYTTPDRIRDIWPSHFASVAEASPFIGHPQALANRVYASRMGNGNELSGDGWRFRGRGLIQITGRFGYEALAKKESRATDPEWLVTMTGAAVSACWFWGASAVALNARSDAWDIPAVTRWVNGGAADLDLRTRLCETALGAFGVASSAADDLNEAELGKIST